MNICVEGPDNSGKSTLVESLAQIYERQIRHAGYTGNHVCDWNLFQEELQENSKLILDRSKAISGYVYDHVVRKIESPFTVDDIAAVARCALLIVCLPPKELVLADNGRDQMKGVNENLVWLYNEYVELFCEGSFDDNSIFIFDYTKHHLGDVIDWITDTLGGPLY